MLLHLIEKDIMIVKKYIFIMMIIAAAIPFFLVWRAPYLSGTIGFTIAVVFTVFILCQYVSMKEYQFPKAATLLCATPYPRSCFVLSKYGFCILIYFMCCVIFKIETSLVPSLGHLNIELLAITFFIVSIFLGIFLPIQFLLGYEKTRFIFTIVIVAFPFFATKLTKLNISSVMANQMQTIFLSEMILLVSLGILGISMYLSTKIYAQKEMA